MVVNAPQRWRRACRPGWWGPGLGHVEKTKVLVLHQSDDVRERDRQEVLDLTENMVGTEEEDTVVESRARCPQFASGSAFNVRSRCFEPVQGDGGRRGCEAVTWAGPDAGIAGLGRRARVGTRIAVCRRKAARRMNNRGVGTIQQHAARSRPFWGLSSRNSR